MTACVINTAVNYCILQLYYSNKINLNRKRFDSKNNEGLCYIPQPVKITVLRSRWSSIVGAEIIFLNNIYSRQFGGCLIGEKLIATSKERDSYTVIKQF